MMNRQEYDHIVGLSLSKTAAIGGLRRLSKLVKPVGKWMGKAYDQVFPVDYPLGRRSRAGLNAPVRDAVRDARTALDNDWHAWDKLNREAQGLPSKLTSRIMKDNNKLVTAPLQESEKVFDWMDRVTQNVRNNPDKYARYPYVLPFNDLNRYTSSVADMFDRRLPSAYRQIYARQNVGREFYKRPLAKAWHNYIKPTLVTGGIGAGIYGLGKFVYDKFTDPQYTE